MIGPLVFQCELIGLGACRFSTTATLLQSAVNRQSTCTIHAAALGMISIHVMILVVLGARLYHCNLSSAFTGFEEPGPLGKRPVSVFESLRAHTKPVQTVYGGFFIYFETE
jgi:hypothetical protein